MTEFRLVAHGKSYRIEADGIVGMCAQQGGPYEPALLERIYEQQFSGLAVDAGAHIGNHTLWLAVVCGLDVVAFEPTSAVEQLRHNIELNALDERVRVEDCALGTKAGFARAVDKGRFVEAPWKTMATSLEPGAEGVQLRSLDSFELQDVAVLKADVEGMEADVLRGGRATIERDKPVIYAESWSKRHSRRVAGVLEPLGYSMTARIKTATPVEEWRC